jgi:hypothetical protein
MDEEALIHDALLAEGVHPLQLPKVMLSAHAPLATTANPLFCSRR